VIRNFAFYTIATATVFKTNVLKNYETMFVINPLKLQAISKVKTQSRPKQCEVTNSH